MKAQPKQLLLWLALVALPIATGFVALGQIPDGVDQVPLHWNAVGDIDGWGRPTDMLGLGFIMAATNVLVAFCYFRCDQMYDAGLVHGVSSPDVARKVLVATAVFIVLLNAGIFAFTVHTVLGAL